MIDRLHIRNFKCFGELSLPLAPLTLMTGFNAAGKSTALQTLLLLAQAMRQGGRSRFVPLNGLLTRLGSPGDVVRDGGYPEVTLGVQKADAMASWNLVPENRDGGHTLAIDKVTWQVNSKSSTVSVDSRFELDHLLPSTVPDSVKEISRNIEEIIFLSAVRSGAEDAFPSPDVSEPVWADVGNQGEYAAWWFENLLDKEIEIDRLHPNESIRDLRRQFNAWAGDLFPGAQANAQRLGRSGLIQLELRNHEADTWRRPANIGYGLSYAFPILISGLIAHTGQTLIIDSPEAHLHPKGQSRMGVFLATLAAAGVQVIVETHSDHVLNGVRLAINQRLLTPEKAAIHFFNSRPRIDTDPAHVVSPQIDIAGNLNEWPAGFFDQAESDLSKLAGWN